jgi:hypothetical protein
MILNRGSHSAAGTSWRIAAHTGLAALAGAIFAATWANPAVALVGGALVAFAAAEVALALGVRRPARGPRRRPAEHRPTHARASQTATMARIRVPADSSGRPAAHSPDVTHRSSALPATTADPAARAFYELALDNGRLRVIVTEPLPAIGELATIPCVSHTEIRRPRQYAAMRLTAIVMAAMVLFAVAAGSTEVALHGFSFFVFRSAGTGSTPATGLKESQGPGQPDAPTGRIVAGSE